MSDDATANDGGDGTPGGQQPSEEQLREYLSQLRTVPADRIVLDALTTVLTAAQGKLGRNDARLFIDLSALMLEHTRPHLPAQQSQQFDQVVGQLRMAQVQAEQQVASSGTEEQNDLPQPPAQPQPGQQPSTPTAHPQPSTSTSRQQAPTPPQQPQPSKLWVPGRP